MMIADYFVIRKDELVVGDLYRRQERLRIQRRLQLPSTRCFDDWVVVGRWWGFSSHRSAGF